jgi:hypothetical protein
MYEFVYNVGNSSDGMNSQNEVNSSDCMNSHSDMNSFDYMNSHNDVNSSDCPATRDGFNLSPLCKIQVRNAYWAQRLGVKD